ncbi:MAG TPA: protein kinase, partial [Gemmatimonadales bacterium]|nr:protein kinase [Gemmatimonadales bacterium]
HDSGTVGRGDGGTEIVYYVMPYVEGESLRDRLKREHQLPVDEAIRIAREVASALDYAHRHGVVHRDIKPENILLHDGQALVADFGIALAASRSDGGTRMTETGMSLGTPHYMAPEQAMGEREITPKADIYALGCVLYEMLTGEPPFTGPTAQAIVARVVTEEPRSLTLQRRTIPPNVDAAVRRALEKLPADRFSTAAEFGEALRNSASSSVTTSVPVAGARRSLLPAPRSLLPWLIAACGLGWGLWQVAHRPQPVPPPAERFTLVFGREAALADGTGSPIAVSPDGSMIAFLGRDSAGNLQLYLRGLERVEPVVVPGTFNADQPFFSPDGRHLGFRQDSKLRRVALAGGAVVTICDVAGAFFGASWGIGDLIVFSQNGRIRRVSASGGQPSDVAVPDSGRSEAFRFPELLPDARTALFTAVTDSGPALRAVRIEDGVVTPLGQQGMSPRYVDGGHLVYAERDGTLFTAPFDAGRLRLTGAPQPITDGVRIGPAQVAKLGISRTGSLAYLSGAASQRDLVLVDRSGRVQVLPAGQQRYVAPRFSPDGRRIAVVYLSTSAAAPANRGRTNGDIWLWDLAVRNSQRITFDTASVSAEWRPDGRRLVFIREQPAAMLFTVPADGSGRPESLLARSNPVYELSMVAGARHLVFRENKLGSLDRDIWMAPVDSPQAAVPVLVTPFDERNPALSPDGRWLAYASNETGALEVYVRGLAEGSGRTRISTVGGAEPRWAQGGRELLFRTADSVYSVSVLPGSEFRASVPRALFGGRFVVSTTTNWDVSPDGRQFVMVRAPESSVEGNALHVVLHWFEQLRAQRSGDAR